MSLHALRSFVQNVLVARTGPAAINRAGRVPSWIDDYELATMPVAMLLAVALKQTSRRNKAPESSQRRLNQECSRTPPNKFLRRAAETGSPRRRVCKLCTI
jgi:hypothetical protein